MQPSRNLSDREMRSLDLQEFLALVQEDLKELDELRRQRRRLHSTEEKPAEPGRRGRRKSAETEPVPEEDEPIIPLTLHTVVCCGKKMGSFPSLARVRCPFCERWHRAGDFPEERIE